MPVLLFTDIYRLLSSLPLPRRLGVEDTVSLSRILLSFPAVPPVPSGLSGESHGGKEKTEGRKVLAAVRGMLDRLYEDTLSLCDDAGDDADRLSRLVPVLYALARQGFPEEDEERLTDCDTLSDRLLFPDAETDRLAPGERVRYTWPVLHGMMRALTEQLEGYEREFLSDDPTASCFRDILLSWKREADPSGLWPALSAEECLGRVELFARNALMWADSSHDTFLDLSLGHCATLAENVPLSPEAFHLAVELERLTGSALLSPETLESTLRVYRDICEDTSASLHERLRALAVVAEGGCRENDTNPGE